MKQPARQNEGSAFPPEGLNAAQYREWIDGEIEDAIKAIDSGEEQFISHEEVRVMILEERLKRAKAKVKAA